jgi:hypothetical protein
MILGMAAVVAMASGCATPQCDELCGAQNLAPYFEALENLGAGKGARPIRILQIGDSHSAGEAIAGAWRTALQARFGGGGRGVLPPGRPFAAFNPRGVNIQQSDGWKLEATFGPDASISGHEGIFGVSGFRLIAQHDGASLTLTADTTQTFNRVVVCALGSAMSGGYVVKIGAISHQVMTASVSNKVVCTTFHADELQTSLSVVAENSPVTITSWATFNDNGGISISNLGVLGAQLKDFAKTDDDAVATELAAYGPDLIVLAFGTNEGFSRRFDSLEYEQLLKSQIARMRRLAGGVPLLLLGAPDADIRRHSLEHDDGPLDSPRAVSRTPDVDPLHKSSAETQASLGPESSLDWYPAPALERVRDVQRQVASESGVAFWNWSARMGGPGSAARWAAMDPPLMSKDRVHYTRLGGAEIARLLQSDLDDAAISPRPCK